MMELDGKVLGGITSLPHKPVELMKISDKTKRSAELASFAILFCLACLPFLSGCSAPEKGPDSEIEENQTDDTGKGRAGESDEASPSASAPGEWRTVATLRSDSPAFQGNEGILVSEPFSAKGKVRLVLEMPDAGPTDGLIGVFIPAEKATTLLSMLSVVSQGVSVVLLGAVPEEIVPDLDGTFVFVNAVPAPKPWSLEIQTKG